MRDDQWRLSGFISDGVGVVDLVIRVRDVGWVMLGLQMCSGADLMANALYYFEQGIDELV